MSWLKRVPLIGWGTDFAENMCSASFDYDRRRAVAGTWAEELFATPLFWLRKAGTHCRMNSVDLNAVHIKRMGLSVCVYALDTIATLEEAGGPPPTTKRISSTEASLPPLSVDENYTVGQR